MFSMSQKDLENILKRLEKLEQEVIFLRQEVKELRNNDNVGEELQNKPNPRRRLLKTFDSKYEGRINRTYDED